MQVRAEIVKALEEPEEAVHDEDSAPETYLINELIREYLCFQGYTSSASVFLKETNLPETSFPRSFLESRVGANADENETKLPILYALLRRKEKAAYH
jgi:FOP N terminal dimerisation domain